MATWHTADSVRADWLDAEQISDPTLLELLAVAQGQVIAYAPAIPATTPATVTLTAGVATLALSRTGDIVRATLTHNDPATNQTFTLPPGFVASLEANFNDLSSWVSIYQDLFQVARGLPDGTTVAYVTADALPAGTIPDSWRLAQRMQTQNLYNAARVDPQGGLGGDGESFVIRPHPLDWQVKALLRPNRGRPRVR